MSLSPEDLKQSLSFVDGLSFEASDRQFADFAEALKLIGDSHKSGYRTSWGEVEDYFNTVRDADLDLEQLIVETERRPQMDGILPGYIAAQGVNVDIADWPEKPDHHLFVRDGRYVLAPWDTVSSPYIIDRLQSLVTDRTQAIIELGCGWGRNLARLSYRLQRPEIAYIGCEPSDTGRRVTEQLLQRTGAERPAVYDFDFYDLQLSHPAPFEEVMVFSCAALEQITFTPPRLLSFLASLGTRVRIVFFEPVGWQRIDNLRPGAVQRLIQNLFGIAPDSLLDTHTFKVQDPYLDMNAAVWSILCRYNMNLLSMIRRATAAQELVLRDESFNAWSANPFNPYSLIVLDTPNFGT